MKQEILGKQVHYVVQGSGDPMLFIHGNPDTSHMWHRLINELKGEFRCIAPDLPGYGESDVLDGFDYSLEQQAEYIERFVASLELDQKVHLVVHDVGGFFGLAWAVTYPERIRSITVFNTAFTPQYRWHKLGRVWRTPLLGEFSLKAMSKGAFIASIRGAAPKYPKEDIIASFDQLTKRTHKSLLKLYRAMSPRKFKGWDQRLQALSQRVPVQVLWGGNDPYIKRFIAHTFGTNQVHFFEENSHWLPAEQPVQSAQLIRRFVADLSVAEPFVADQQTNASASEPAAVL
ncbi:alpha/beta fold hydrolase [Litoribrevibacter albus]|uniref:Oxidoreductase n=1 Tax=Litoribrevibacter albus TaxID=1473156 RepID=A0AA37SBC7_9GAMM|nr:alpha/beta fold hydrolase [Litoribrevibacter albus]GLQ32947.1 oxidoreductase [Litoribrevibacter albus]